MKRSLQALILTVAVFLTGCHTDMWVQPKYRPYQESELFADGSSSRPLEPGVVVRGSMPKSSSFVTGFDKGKLATTIPNQLSILDERVDTRKDLKRVLKWGQERFFIYCSPCHGQVGDGNGMIAQRGLSLVRPPANLHTQRLRDLPIGHIFDVQTNGFGVMLAQASRVPPDDRWAIAAYIRALQYSQFAPVDTLPAESHAQLSKLSQNEAEAR